MASRGSAPAGRASTSGSCGGSPTLEGWQFNAHWRDNHSRVHVAASPGTCHYEQLIIDETPTPGAPEWDGVGLLSFAAASEYTDRLFGGSEDQKAIMDDVARFLDLPEGETLPASEYVYRDSVEIEVTAVRPSHGG